ncbi:GNAT family N-acetyltransferase [Streptomyces sp. 549]|uniref:GNAT family N-acetyltransferase n=1 Tax=Streptomyces sp. 549 TaxID=3049076 RepID=UPI0032E35DB2
MVTLRALTTDDWPLWREVRRAALAEAPHAFKTRLADWHRGGGVPVWRCQAPTTSSRCWTAEPLAWPAAFPQTASHASYGPYGVSPGTRGRGVGDRLMSAVETWNRQSGATTLKLAVLPDNGHAIAFYQRHGFSATGELGDLLSDGVTREHVMAKALL